MNTTTKKRGVLYARYSSDNQRSESIDAQVRAILDYAMRNGYEIRSPNSTSMRHKPPPPTIVQHFSACFPMQRSLIGNLTC